MKRLSRYFHRESIAKNSTWIWWLLRKKVYVTHLQGEKWFILELIQLTLLYDIGKSVFDPLDGTDSVSHLAWNYHLAAF